MIVIALLPVQERTYSSVFTAHCLGVQRLSFDHPARKMTKIWRQKLEKKFARFIL